MSHILIVALVPRGTMQHDGRPPKLILGSPTLHQRGGLESMFFLRHRTSMGEKSDTLPARISAALLLLRIASAMAFLYHGSAILFGSFGGPGPQQFAASHHWPVVMGYLIGLAQLAGGLAVLSGILFRLGAVCLVVVMLGAIFLVHLPNGFDIGKGGAEYALTQLVLAVAFLLTGPGSYLSSVRYGSSSTRSKSIWHGSGRVLQVPCFFLPRAF